MGAAKNKEEHFASLASRISYLRDSSRRSTTMRDEDQGPKLNATNHEDNEGPDGSGNDGEADINEDGVSESIQNNSDYDEDINASDEQQVGVHNSEPTLPLHREIFMPIIWHPSVDQFSPDPYMQSSLRVDEDANDVLDSLDNSVLVDEFLEEETIDVADIAASEEAEAELWARFSPSEKGEEESFEAEVEVPVKEAFPEPRVPDQIVENNSIEKRISRLKFGKPSNRVKSNVYIDNSD